MFELVCLLFMGCIAETPPEMRVYEKEFRQTYTRAEIDGVRIYPVSSRSSLVGDNHAAECHYNEQGPNRAFFDMSWWEDAPSVKKRALVWHEMAHCLYEIAHVPKEFSDGCPVSIMHPRIHDTRCFDDPPEWQYYVAELRFRLLIR